ncbi:MAG TPA: hypothetical protein VEL74_24545 [Thermoanaerobaculia bacterium]|nr:hypothetical protein [Thermoanaerobaculia bacterium]
MGIEHEYMIHLFDVATALEAGKLSSIKPYGPTPDGFSGGTPNQKLLLAAVSYCDAVAVQAPGLSVDKAKKLVQQLIGFQKQAHCLVGKAWEPLTPSHGQLWWAGWLAILALAARGKDAATEAAGVSWVRAEAALCHLSGAYQGGCYVVFTPGARGGRPDKTDLTTNPARDMGYDMLVTGKMPSGSKWKNQYNVGPYFLSWLCQAQPATFQRLREPGSGTFLAGPKGVEIWTEADLPNLINPLHVTRTGAEFVSWFPVLETLEPQWFAALLGSEPQFGFWNGQAELKNGGPCPYPIPALSNPQYQIVVGSGGVA